MKWEVEISEDQTIVSVFGHNPDQNESAHFRLTVSSNKGTYAAASMAEVIVILMESRFAQDLLRHSRIVE